MTLSDIKQLDFKSPPVLAVTIVVMFGVGSCVGQLAHDFFAPEAVVIERGTPGPAVMWDGEKSVPAPRFYTDENNRLRIYEGK